MKFCKIAIDNDDGSIYQISGDVSDAHKIMVEDAIRVSGYVNQELDKHFRQWLLNAGPTDIDAMLGAYHNRSESLRSCHFDIKLLGELTNL